MEWFWSNPVTAINGYAFLIIYMAIVIACRYILINYEKKLINKTCDSSSPVVNDDLLFIAWLKDTKNGICKMVLGPLIEEGYIKKIDKSGLYQTTKKVKPQKTGHEVYVLKKLKMPQPLKCLHEHFKKQTAVFIKKAEKLELIVKEDVKKKILRVNRIFSLMLMLFGLYRIITGNHSATIVFIFQLMAVFFIVPALYNENRFSRVMFTPKCKYYLQKYQECLLTSENKNAQQVWLLKILSGGAIVSGLNAYTPVDDDVYFILSDSFDSSYSSYDSSDSSYDSSDSSCDSSDSSCSND